MPATTPTNGHRYQISVFSIVRRIKNQPKNRHDNSSQSITTPTPNHLLGSDFNFFAAANLPRTTHTPSATTATPLFCCPRKCQLEPRISAAMLYRSCSISNGPKTPIRLHCQILCYRCRPYHHQRRVLRHFCHVFAMAKNEFCSLQVLFSFGYCYCSSHLRP